MTKANLRTKPNARPLDGAVIQLEIPEQLIQMERRLYRRVKDSRQIRLRPCESVGTLHDEVRVVENSSANGLYLLSSLDGYWEGMKLFVTIPNSVVPSASDLNYLGMVTRVEPLRNGRRGIAVHLLETVNFNSHVAEKCRLAAGSREQ